MRSTLAPLSVLTLLVLAACNQAPTEGEYDEVAAGLGSLVANSSGGGDVGSMSDAVVAAKGEVPQGLSAMGEGSYRGTRAGLEYSYAVTCMDAAGATLPLCGATTDSGRLTVAWSGMLTLDNFMGSVDRTGDWTVTGVQGPAAEFNGNGTFDVEAEWRGFFGAMNSYELHYDAQYEAIRIDTTTLRPQSGTARWDVDAKRFREGTNRTTEREWTIAAVLEFSGGGAVLTLDGSRNYSVDLNTGAVARQ